MLLGNAHVKGTIRHGRHHQVHRGARWHGRGYPHDACILFSKLDHCMPKDILVFGRLRAAWSFFVNLSSQLVKCSWGMPGGFVSAFGWAITLSFDGNAMEDFWSRNILKITKNLD